MSTGQLFAQTTFELGSLGSGSPPSGAFTPAQIEQAYGFNQIYFNGTPGNGSGETIAIVDAYNDPNIQSDVATFDSQFGLPSISLTVVNQTGGTTLPISDSTGGWELEESLDIEWAHAMAPAANILLVEASSNSGSDLFTAVQYAAAHATVVSMSWAGAESSGETSYDNEYFNEAGVAFVASSGDSGAPAQYPSASPNVLSVGGTALTLDAENNWSGEVGWSGSGGGPSAYEPQPAYQTGVVTQTSTQRATPDVAYDASPSTGFAVYDSFPYEGAPFDGAPPDWVEVGGTSCGAPQWSALLAIADQGRALNHLAALNSSGPRQVATILYENTQDFHDITSGTSTGNPNYSAGPAYDYVTGLGSPMANLVVASLVGAPSPATYTVTSTADSGPGTLRAAIAALDSSGGPSNIINFDIPGSGVQTISPASAMPTITKPVTLEGTVSEGVPQIQILGGSAGSGASGLTFGGGSSGSSVQGLMIAGFASDGIDITSSSTGDSVLGCWLGINAFGTADANECGLVVAASGATIGWTTTGAGNTISDNSQAGIDVTSGATAVITDDAITGNGIGIVVGSGGSDTCLVTAQDDNLSGNTTAGITNNQTNASYAVTADDDWWRSLHGPTTTANLGGNGTGVSANVKFTPWIGAYTQGAGPGFQPTGITLYAVPTQLVFVTEPPSAATVGTAFATQPVVEAEDANGNLGINFDATTVPGAKVVMTLNALSGTGVLAGITSVSPSGGFASFSGLDITAVGTYTLTASSSGFGSLPWSATSSQTQIYNSSIFTVTSTGTGNVTGTLLYAINALDSTGGSSNIIDFDIPGPGVQTISLTSALPTITKPVTIQGTASGGVPQIQISPYSVGGSGSGLVFGAGSSGSTVQDLTIEGFLSGDGIDITSSSANDRVIGCWLGIYLGGFILGANGTGVYIQGSGATIGGTAVGAGNVISANFTYGVDIAAPCLVEGNEIGTNAAGTAAQANENGIYVLGSGATIGGTTAGAGNVISGNSGYGIDIAAPCLVEGNDIGTNAAGAAALPNGDDGIFVNASGATIGGTVTGAGNIISGNTYYGVHISASCLVEGNDIGTNAAGSAALANNTGIYVTGAGATIGGTASGAGNIISGNGIYGVYINAACLLLGNDIGTNSVGTAPVANVFGIYVNASGATIGGITTGAGNVISGNTSSENFGVYVNAACLIEGNYIGTNAAGTAAVANDFGIAVFAANATIGGTAAGAGNVISGNTYDGIGIAASCLIEGNKIGTNAAGTAAVPNGTGELGLAANAGVDVEASGATIGGTTSGAGNVISGNEYDGVYIDASCLVEGNEIGTNAAGTAPLPNGSDGIYVSASGSGAQIGGTGSRTGNTISGNTNDGIYILASCLVLGNEISDNNQAGINVSSGATATITDDAINGDGTGILVGGGASDTCLVTAQDDDLSGNTTAGIINNQTNPSYAVSATDDWWGSLHGPTTPANPGGNGSSVSSNVNFTPWIGVYTPSAGVGFQPTGVTLYAVPTQLVFVTEPSSAAYPGVAFATQPVIEAEDAGGNLGINFDASTVPGAQPVPTLNTLSGTGTLAGITSVSPSGGFASFSGLNITAIGTYTLTTSASGFGSLPLSGTSSQINVTTPLTVIATQPPPGVLAGNAFGLTVDEVNALNQLDTSYDGSVTVSLASNPGNSTLGGTLTVQASGGVATFTGLTISNPGLAYTLQVSAAGTTPVTTANVDVAGYQLAPDATDANLDDLYWYGTSGPDQVQFVQTAAGTVQITVSELAGIATSFTTTIMGVTGKVVVNEHDVAGDTDVIDGGGLTTISSMITVGNGNDTIIGGGGANTIVAGNGGNTIYGNGLGNSPNASGVQDSSNTITVGNGNNIIYGNYSGSGYQGGNNSITAGDGSNTIYGNYGDGGYTGDGAEGSNNTITVGNGENTIYGNYGTADGGEGGSNTIIAGDGNNIIYGNANGSDIKRKQGDNFIQVGNGTNTIYGNLGGDGGEGGNNTILTGSGPDTIYGNFGGDGGEGGNNLIVAGGGNDIIYAHCALPVTSTTSGTTAAGRDLIIGGNGADTVYGWPAGYTLGSNTGDLFIAGTTNLGLTALDAVLAEWDSPDSYATRVADLSGTNGAVGANGGNDLISGTTVIGSTAIDEVFGTVGSDGDWYLVTSNDVLHNVNPDEVTLID